MPRFSFLLQGAIAVLLLSLGAGCSSTTSNVTAKETESQNIQPTYPVVISKSPAVCPYGDRLTMAMNKAVSATSLAKSAKTSEDWISVVISWKQALDTMQAVPKSSPKKAFVQKKTIEYQQKLQQALLKAASTRTKLPFASFDNAFLNEQIRLYLLYVAAMGTPDVLIVGSSRTVLGIDPQVLEETLATKRDRRLKVYNFGVNGATAQVVDLILRQILTSEQLPRLIIWADGLRAFNSGRIDRTYNKIIASPGYKQLLKGDRPTLAMSVNASDPCISVSSSSISHTSKAIFLSNTNKSQKDSIAQSLFDKREPKKADLPTIVQTKPNQELNTAEASVSAIEFNGFLPWSARFKPDIYYKQNGRISGQYDADYQEFNLGGIQGKALDSVKAFTKSHKIPLVFVNLPLTKEYLDPIRLKYEEGFKKSMQPRKNEKGFVFIDLSGGWPTRNDYFADPSHLNRFGAAIVSRQLATNTNIPWPRSR